LLARSESIWASEFWIPVAPWTSSRNGIANVSGVWLCVERSSPLERELHAMARAEWTRGKIGRQDYRSRLPHLLDRGPCGRVTAEVAGDHTTRRRLDRRRRSSGLVLHGARVLARARLGLEVEPDMRVPEPCPCGAEPYNMMSVPPGSPRVIGDYLSSSPLQSDSGLSINGVSGRCIDEE
jgi:hypothetical protein